MSFILTDEMPFKSLVILPVELDMTPVATWRQTHFGTAANSGNAADNSDPDGDGLVNLVEYAVNSDPNTVNSSPLSYGIIGEHLTITFQRPHPAPAEITYLFEVANDLSGPWQTGPAVTTQTVTDNHDGTETVVVTDNAPIGNLTAHYLRVRISEP